MLFEQFSGKFCLNFFTLILNALPNMMHLVRTFSIMLAFKSSISSSCIKAFASTVCESGAKGNYSTLLTLLNLCHLDCANKQPNNCHLSLHHGRCLCHYCTCRSIYCNSRALSVALFSTLINFLFNSASVSVSSSKNQAHYYKWSEIKSYFSVFLGDEEAP